MPFRLQAIRLRAIMPIQAMYHFTAGCAGEGVMEKTPALLGLELDLITTSVVDWSPNH